MVSTAFWLLLLGLVSHTSTISTVEPRIKVDHIAPQEPFLDQCTPVPTWTIGGEQAVNLVGKNITVVALLNSSRLFGRKQAVRLSSLRNRLYQAGFPEINFFVINSILATDNTNLLQNEAVNIPVYQEHPEAPVRDILGAENDHILVLDRCGRLAYQVITPFSKLIYPYVKAAILSTYNDNPCGLCNSSEVDMEIEEHNTLLRYVSDEPVHDSCMFCNIHTRLVTNSETSPQISVPVKVYGEENQSHTSVLIQPQGNDLSTTKNQLTQLFQNLSTTQLYESKDNSKSGVQLIALRNAEDWHRTFNATSSTLSIRYDQHPSRPIFVSRIPEGQELTRNWNWFEQPKAVERTQSSVDSKETESVEVVGQVTPSKMGKRKKNKNKRKEYTSDNHLVQEPLENHITDCRKHQKCHSNSLAHELLLDSQEIVHDSMEALVNQTQRLFDWYQRQIENGTSSEEENEKSNILKEKIIEHYSRLLPWLNFKLTPETDIQNESIITQ